MPIKDFQKFESAFYKDGEFCKKIYEEYWGDEYRNNDDDDDNNDWNNVEEDPVRISSMISNMNLEKLHVMGLGEYSDIAKSCITFFEKQIAAGSYGKTIVPSIDIIRDYIITTIGLDYKSYISENKLDDLSKFIYQEIDNYVFD